MEDKLNETIRQLTSMNDFLISLGYNVENMSLNEGLAILNGLKEVLKTSEVLTN